MKVLVFAVPTAGLDPDDGRWAPFLSPQRRATLARTANPAARVQSLAAELALIAASLRLGRTVPPIYRREKTTGKPCFPVAPPYFSLSHCRGLALCALADGPVGVDVEPADRRPAAPLAARILAPGETCASPLETWVAKESYLKLTGEGLRRDMRSVVLRGERILSAGDGRELARIAPIPLPGYCAALAAARRPQPETETVDPGALFRALVTRNGSPTRIL